METLMEIVTFDTDGEFISSLAFDPMGRILAAAKKQSIIIYNLDTLSEVATLMGNSLIKTVKFN